MSSVPITFRVDDAVKAELDAIASKTGRSVSNVVQLALVQYMAARQERLDALDAAMGDVEAGRVVSWDATRAWMESLDTATPLVKPSPKTR